MEDKQLTSPSVNKENRISGVAQPDAADIAEGASAPTSESVTSHDMASCSESSDTLKDHDAAAKTVSSQTRADARTTAVKTDREADADVDEKTADLEDTEACEEEEAESDKKSGKKDKKSGKKDDADEAEENLTEELREPGSVFIDHGAILPEFIPGTHLFALIRDPGTLYVYWNSEVESAHGWRLTAFDAHGNTLQSFTTTHRRNGRGYFHIPTMLVSRVTLEMVQRDGTPGMTLESTIKIREQSNHKPEERWVDVQNNEVVFEAPSVGQAPEYAPALEAHRAQLNAVSAPAPQTAMVSRPADMMPSFAPSSWFRPFGAPGSSDIFMGSSDICPGSKN